MLNTFNFQILSLNVRGLGEFKKNKKVFNWLYKHDGHKGVSFLQETHSSQNVMDQWSKQTKGSLIMSHGSSRSRGVAILMGSKLNHKITTKILDPNGRYILLLSEIEGSNFLLINTYLPNYEKEQVLVLKDILEKIHSIDIPDDTCIIWGGDLNVVFDIALDSSGGNPEIKTKSIETIETIMTEYDLCDIWRIRNPYTKRFTWRGKAQGKRSSSEILYRRLDYFLISDCLQSYVEKCDIVPAPSTDHSAITLKFKSFETENRGPSFWKFNNSLLEFLLNFNLQ